MFNMIFILLAATIAISGCSSNTAPIPVERVPGTYTAINLPALSDQWGNGVLQLAPKNKNGCGQFLANILPSPVDDDYFVEIEGNRDTFFHVSRTGAQSECNLFGMFYATKGNEYIIKFEIKNKQCEFSLLEKTPRGSQSRISTYPSYVSAVDGIKVCESKEKLY